MCGVGLLKSILELVHFHEVSSSTKSSARSNADSRLSGTRMNYINTINC